MSVRNGRTELERGIIAGAFWGLFAEGPVRPTGRLSTTPGFAMDDILIGDFLGRTLGTSRP